MTAYLLDTCHPRKRRALNEISSRRSMGFCREAGHPKALSIASWLVDLSSFFFLLPSPQQGWKGGKALRFLLEPLIESNPGGSVYWLRKHPHRPPTRMIVQSLKDFLEEQLPDWRLLRGSNSNASAPDCISSWNRSSPLPTPSSQEGWIDRIDLDRSRLSSDPTSLATLSPVIRWFPRWSRQDATTFRSLLRGGISLTFRAFPAHFRPSSRGDSYALRMPWKIEREC